MSLLRSVMFMALFLSTLSLRRATVYNPCLSAGDIDFYPRSPCGERQTNLTWQCLPPIFLSTLSLRRATLGEAVEQATGQFLSTLSLRRATGCHAYFPYGPFISIHALLAESDQAHIWTVGQKCDFYPRSPCGERPYVFFGKNKNTAISIHALLAESDIAPCQLWHGVFYFYPRSPCGERRVEWRNKPQVSAISIHALLAESDNSSEHPVA